MEQILQGKHALVTGGGTGIGLAIARALAGAGAVVSITGRRAAVLQQATQGAPGLFAQPMDVSDEASVTAGFRAATDAHGPVDICVANAGIARGNALPKTELDFWRTTMATNLDGAFLTIREALKSMQDQPWGRVIAVSSIAGISGLRGASAYAASKHGMIGLVRSLAMDHVSSGITFNALCPGYVQTDIIDQNIANITARTGMSRQKALDVMVSANPHGRLIAPAEVATAALWLCNSGADSVNGQAIEISGGRM